MATREHPWDRPPAYGDTVEDITRFDSLLARELAEAGSEADVIGGLDSLPPDYASSASDAGANTSTHVHTMQMNRNRVEAGRSRTDRVEAVKTQMRSFDRVELGRPPARTRSVEIRPDWAWDARQPSSAEFTKVTEAWNEEPEFACISPEFVGSKTFISQFGFCFVMADIMCIIFAAITYVHKDDKDVSDRRHNMWMQALIFVSASDLFVLLVALPMMGLLIDFLDSSDAKAATALSMWLFIQVPWLILVYLLCSISPIGYVVAILMFAFQRIAAIVLMPVLGCYTDFFHRLLDFPMHKRIIS